MKVTTASALACLATAALAAQNERTFAVLRFNENSTSNAKFMTEARIDPVVDPGKTAAHLHGVMGGNAFGMTVEGDDLIKKSTCTNAKIANDKSNYWAPEVFFQDPKTGKFTKVPLFYMNVYYFFEPTDDETVAFPVGLKMLIGNTKTRDPPGSGAINLDPNMGEIQPIQWTCPRTSYSPASYLANSDGKTSGLQDPQNEGAGAGFPLYPCDGFASPLRQDIHFPSCYNPAAGLDDYKNNMKFPSSSNGKLNCPKGWMHVPHIFYELYWDTPQFNDKWTPDGKTQPFVLSNGDATGYSSHGDFISGWDRPTLQKIIDTCNAGSAGMDQCPDIPGGLNNDPCTNTLMVDNHDESKLDPGLPALPGNNPVTGWGKGGVTGGTGDSGADSDASPAEPAEPAAPADPTAPAEPVATSPAPPVSVIGGGAKAVVKPSADSQADEPAAPTQYEEVPPVPTSPTEGQSNKGHGQSQGDPVMVTEWDYETVTETKTKWLEPTGVAKRHVHQGHMARHLRGGRMGRL